MIWIIAGVIAAVLVLKRMTLISQDDARKFLRQGALVVDVRDAGEYSGGHLPQAVNIPLGDLRNTFHRHVKDKKQVLLLHCFSGTRSGIAKNQLKSMGYPNVYNLGSFGRAGKIINGGRGN